MRPQDTGIVEFHDTKQKERGFNCMKLIAFLTEDGVTKWEEWHGAHLQAADGCCPYTDRCEIHSRTIDRALNDPKKRAIQYTLNFDF